MSSGFVVSCGGLSVFSGLVAVSWLGSSGVGARRELEFDAKNVDRTWLQRGGIVVKTWSLIAWVSESSG
jgi:hypothetical protein